MHGRLKIKTTAQQAAERDREREAKAREFQASTQALFDKRLNKDFSDESLKLSGNLLVVNPDFSTIWNFRREILNARIAQMKEEATQSALLPGPGGDQVQSEKVSPLPTTDTADSARVAAEPMESESVPIESESTQIDTNSAESNAQVDNLLRGELELTFRSLHANPKSYSVWHHRAWTVTLMHCPDLKTEIALCGQMLDLDKRNFHCWDYRRFVSKLAAIGRQEELEFTLARIRQDFSNFSSWFYRSSVFDMEYFGPVASVASGSLLSTDPAALAPPPATHVMPLAVWKAEYDLVENAFFTDPKDQAPWLYVKWLLSVAGIRIGSLNAGDSANASSELSLLSRPRSSSVVPMETSTIDLSDPKLIQSDIASIIYDPKYGRLIIRFKTALQSVPFSNFTILCRQQPDTSASANDGAVSTPAESNPSTGTGHHRTSKSSSDWSTSDPCTKCADTWYHDLPSKERLDTHDISEIHFFTALVSSSSAAAALPHLKLSRVDPLFVYNYEWIEKRHVERQMSIQSDVDMESIPLEESTSKRPIDSFTSAYLTKEKLTNLEELFHLEPDNKWVNLIMSTILKENSVFEKLTQMDPLRKRYYLDMQSKQRFLSALAAQVTPSTVFRLPDAALTGLHFTHLLTHLRTLDLTGNHLTHLGAAFNSFLCLETLIVDRNRIVRIASGFQCDHLITISLKHNRIGTEEGVRNLRACKRLKRVLIEGNPLVARLLARRREDTEIWYLDMMDIY